MSLPSAGQPKRLVNFDSVLPEPIRVTRGGQTLDLRDDVPMVEVVRVFRVIEHQQALASQADMSAEQVEAWFEEMRRLTLERCLAFVRHSHPRMTADELGEWLDFEQQLQLVMLFFQIRSATLSRPPSALDGVSPASATATADGPAQPATTTAEPARDSATGSHPRASRGRGDGTTPRKR